MIPNRLAWHVGQRLLPSSTTVRFLVSAREQSWHSGFMTATTLNGLGAVRGVPTVRFFRFLFRRARHAGQVLSVLPLGDARNTPAGLCLWHDVHSSVFTVCPWRILEPRR